MARETRAKMPPAFRAEVTTGMLATYYKHHDPHKPTAPAPVVLGDDAA